MLTSELPQLIDTVHNLIENFDARHRLYGNKEYADLLNRLRFGQHTDEDILKIRSRVVKDFSTDVPTDSILIFCKNKPVDDFNSSKLEELPGDLFEIKAKHIGQFRPNIKSHRQNLFTVDGMSIRHL